MMTCPNMNASSVVGKVLEQSSSHSNRRSKILKVIVRNYRGMKISRTALTRSAMLLPAALIFTYFQSQEPTDKSMDVFTWDCVSAEYKPESITLTCADGGWSIQAITWSAWSTQGATGNGIWRENLCEPSCAEGKFAEAKVKINLTGLTPYKGKFYLRTIDITTNDGKDFPWGRAGAQTSDLMEFLK